MKISLEKGVVFVLSVLVSGCVSQRVSWSREPASRTLCHSAAGCALSCAVRGGTSMRVDWLHAHTGDPVRTLTPLREVFENGTLVVSRWSAPEFRADVHGGAYRCRASEPTGAELLSRITTLVPVMSESWEARVEAWRGAASALLACRVPDHVTVTRWLRDHRPLTDADPEMSVGGAQGQYLVVRSGVTGVAGGSGGQFACEGTHSLSGETRRSVPLDIALLPVIVSVEPRIIETAGEESVAEGGDIRLVCFAVGEPPITYSWFRVWARGGGGGGEVEAVSSGVRVSVRGELLTVRRATPHADEDAELATEPSAGGAGDAGTWRCRAHNWVAATRRDLTLRVTVPLAVSISPPLQVVPAGGVAEFVCSWRGGSGTARVRWGRGEGAARGPAGVGGARLRLAPVTRSLQGLYQCFVERDDDNAQAVAEIRLGESAPVLMETFIEQALHAGARVALSCRVLGAPPARVRWLRDNQPLDEPGDGDRSITVVVTGADEVVSSLNMSAVRPELGGRYTCRADNAYGTVQHSARLNVYGPPAVRSTSAVRLVAGDNATLYCPYYGYPISSVEWVPGGTGVGAGVGAGAGVAQADGSLWVSGVERGDAGRVVCRVSGPAGSAQGELHIDVREPPKISGFTFPNDLQEGMSVQVLCGITSGDRPIYFSWLKDGDRIPTTLQVEEKTMEDFSFLRFSRVTARHGGQYTCVATNEAARVTHTATLIVKAPPHWVTAPRAVTVRRGAALFVPCDVTGTPPPNVTWLHGDGSSEATFSPLLPGGVRVSSRGALVSASATRGVSGAYMCRADNRVGKPLQKIITVTVNEPAHFEDSSDSELVSVRRGDTATLTCAARGDAPLHLHWKHNGRDLDLTSFRVVMEQSSGVSRVRVTAATRRDAGLYACRAHNRHGAAERLIYLTVREAPEPPVGLQWSSAEGVLRWSPPSPAPRSYSLQLVRVEGGTPGEGGVDWTSAETRHIAAHTISHLTPTMARLALTGVSPGARYAVRLAADNELGRSNYSQVLVADIREEAPSEPPHDFQVLANVPGELQLTWQPPPRSSWNGELLGYVYCWRARGALPPPSPSPPPQCGTARPRDVTGGVAPLATQGHYDVTVRAFNVVGLGPPAHTITVAAAPIAPQWAPEHVRCEGISTDSIQIWWDVPEELRALQIIGFDVIYEAGGAGSCGWVVAGAGARGAATSRHGAGRHVTVWVRARGPHGAGPANTAVCTTRDDLPGPPSNIKLVANSDDSVLVVWLPPQQKNGEILYYNVYTRSESGGVSSQRVAGVGVGVGAGAGAGAGGALAASVSRARAVWLSAVTRAGEGDASAVLTVTHQGLSSIASFGGLVPVSSGRPTRLKCAARGEWTVEGRPLPRNSRYLIDGDYLIIQSVEDDTAGNYTCTVRGAGSAPGREEHVTWRVASVSLPPAPRLTLAAATHTRLILSWTHVGNEMVKVHSYEVEWQWTGSKGPWSRALVPAGCAMGGRGAEALALTLEGGTCGGAARARARARGPGGGGAWGEELHAHTRGGAPKSPSEKDMIFTNSTCVRINLLAWDCNGCPITSFLISYREFSVATWTTIASKHDEIQDSSVNIEQTDHWGIVGGFALEPFAVCNLRMATWHHLRIQARNDAGTTTNTYYFATLTETGQAVPAPASWPAAEGSAGLAVGMGGVAGVIAGAILAIAAILYWLSTPLRNCCSSKGYEAGSSEDKTDSKESMRPPSQPVYTSSPIKNGNLKEQDSCDVYEISPYATFSMAAVAAADSRAISSSERYKSISLALSAATTRSDSESSESMCSECQPYNHRDKGGGSSHPVSHRSVTAGSVAGSVAGRVAGGGERGVASGGARVVGGSSGGVAGPDSSASSSASSRRERTRRRSKRTSAASTPTSARYSRQEQERRDFTIHV